MKTALYETMMMLLLVTIFASAIFAFTLNIALLLLVCEYVGVWTALALFIAEVFIYELYENWNR